MQKLKRAISMLLCFTALFTFAPCKAFAQSTALISLEPYKESYSVGEQVCVFCTVNTVDVDIYALLGTLNFNSTVLKYVSGADSSNRNVLKVAPSMQGENTYTATFVFEAVAEGYSDLSYTAELSDGNIEENARASVTVKVSGKGETFHKTHTPYLLYTVEPTCHLDGYSLYRCADCGLVFKGDVKKHTSTSYLEATYPATCTKDGYCEYVCDTCGETYTVPTGVLAQGHFFHNGFCAVCDISEKYVTCDLNKDCKIDALDIALVRYGILNGDTECDVNGDKKIDLIDLIKIKKALSE